MPSSDSDALLSVRGESLIEVDPEIARLDLTVAARDDDRARAMHLLEERALQVDQILGRHAAAIEKKETTSVRVSPQLKSRKAGERVTGYVATVRHRITVSEFGGLGELIAQLADWDMTEVDGPWWSLRPDSDSYRTARTEATRDAVRRAQDYAAALGGTLGDLVEFADTGLLSDSDARPVQFRTAMAARAGGTSAPEEFTFDISPAKQSVRATVEARFRMTRHA
jgi:uncharacterized protein YggE